MDGYPKADMTFLTHMGVVDTFGHITAMGCRQCLSLSVVQLKGKHCRKPHCRNGVVGTFGQCPIEFAHFEKKCPQEVSIPTCQLTIFFKCTHHKSFKFHDNIRQNQSFSGM